MEFKDYYTTLGVSKNASQDEIQRAYRKLARQYHPDVNKNPGAEERFKDIGEAYEVLKDPEKRSAYDQLGTNWKSGQDFRPPPDWDAGFEFHGGPGADAGAFSDFFESLFGRQGFSRGGADNMHRGFRMRGEDHHAKVLINVEDAYKGSKQIITLRSPEVDAKGHVQLKERGLNVQIPKGIKPGQRIRLTGQGGKGSDGQSGDLYLEIEFKPHSLYQVEDRNVYIELPVTPWEAALGAKVKVPTPDGTVELSIPANTTSGNKLRLKGRGIPGNPPGDLYVSPRITLPPADNEKAKQLYRKMEQELAYNPRVKLGV